MCYSLLLLYKELWEGNCVNKDENVDRKVQEVPKSQTAANPRHQEEEKKTKTNTFKTNIQMYEKHIDQLPLPRLDQLPKTGDHNTIRNEETRAREDFKT